VEIWRALEKVTLAKTEINGQIFYKLSEVSSYAQKLLTLANIPTLNNIFSE